MNRYQIRKAGGHYDVIDNKNLSVKIGFASYKEAQEYIRNAGQLKL